MKRAVERGAYLMDSKILLLSGEGEVFTLSTRTDEAFVEAAAREVGRRFLIAVGVRVVGLHAEPAQSVGHEREVEKGAELHFRTLDLAPPPFSGRSMRSSPKSGS